MGDGVAVLRLRRPDVRHRQLEVGVRGIALDAVAHVDHERGVDERRGGQVVDARSARDEVTRRAHVRTRMRAHRDELELVPVRRNRVVERRRKLRVTRKEGSVRAEHMTEMHRDGSGRSERRSGLRGGLDGGGREGSVGGGAPSEVKADDGGGRHDGERERGAGKTHGEPRTRRGVRVRTPSAGSRMSSPTLADRAGEIGGDSGQATTSRRSCGGWSHVCIELPTRGPASFHCVQRSGPSAPRLDEVVPWRRHRAEEGRESRGRGAPPRRRRRRRRLQSAFSDFIKVPQAGMRLLLRPRHAAKNRASEEEPHSAAVAAAAA